ncbi:unnamed protein product [Ophioblennius macclurei]
MTQQEQQDFKENLEAALSWMRVVHERLKANDNTQGPRDALEARLRETEKIHQSEHEGRVKMDKALVAGDILLQSGDEEQKNHVQTKLKEMKSLWEETSIYIVHCHSRIEWVWLHWSEYLKAYEEFELWLAKQQRGVAVDAELQLGVKEKLWQVDQQRVVVSDIHSQSGLLERLLDEAAALHNRTQDPSVDGQAQERLQEAYNDVKDKAEERLSLLQKIAEEHQMYQSCAHKFQSWILSKTKELADLMEREGSAEDKLKALQALDDSVTCEEKTLQHIEGVAEAVRANTSPAGAEATTEEAEELRLGWLRLRRCLCETEDALRSSLDSHGQYVARCQRLGDDIGRLRALLQGLDQELARTQGSRDGAEEPEEQMVGRWRKYTGVRNTLTGEESQVELLKAQLKELFRFSEDSHHLSDDVLAVVKEHQSVKCRANKLCSESESGLRSVLQDPLLSYGQWSHKVSQVLEASADVSDFSHIAMLVQNIERLLKDSAVLQERLNLLQDKSDLLDSVFGPERAEGLQGELSSAVRNRELLHAQLLQRKSRLQGLISRTKDFGDAHEQIRSRLATFGERLLAADGLQPDILAKKSQADQFRVIQRDLEDCDAHITALETLVSSSPSNRSQFEKLSVEWKHLHKTARAKVHESEDNVGAHESFHDSLLNIEKWLMIMRQKLESFHGPSGEWSIESRRHEAEKVLGEFPEKELQLQQMQVQGQGVLEKTSEEGRVHIVRDMTRLRESWMALYSMSLNLHGLLIVSSDQTDSVSTEMSGVSGSSGSVGAGRLSVDAAEGAATAAIRGRDGHVPPIGMSQEHPLPHKTGKDVGQSIKGALVDSFAWSGGSSRAGSGGAAGDSASAKVTVGDSSAGGRRGAASSAQVGFGFGERVETIRAEDDAVDGGLGSGSGAFIVVRKGSAEKATGTAPQDASGLRGQNWSRRREFEAWLSKENQLLAGILSSQDAPLSPKDLRIRKDTLEALRSRLGWGQEQFQLLLQENDGTEPGLEDLRYRWMLYKSKLKDLGDLRARVVTKKEAVVQEEATTTAEKPQKKPGFLQRVCRLALPLWLLLLGLLLLAFLLPLMDEGSSCSLSNNFARSFNVMLRYDGPPPT